MKICFISPLITGVISGGIQIQMDKTAKYLTKLGHEIIKYSAFEKYDFSKIDLVHIFRTDQSTLPMAEWLYNNNIPFVVSPVFFSLHPVYKIRAALLYTKLAKVFLPELQGIFESLKKISEMATLILPNTTEELNMVKEITGIDKNKLRVIPNAVSKEFTNANADMFIEKYHKKDFILTAGHFGFKRKNFLNMAKALKNSNIDFIIIGRFFDDEYGKKCKRIIETSKNMTLIDFLPNESPMLKSAYSAAKTFVLPSQFETPGLSALEAALAGCNIVITPIGGTREYFEDFVEYCDHRSVDSIKKAVLKAHEKESNSTPLRQRILENFTWEICATKTESAYKDALNMH